MRLMLIAWLVCLTCAILVVCESRLPRRVRSILIGIVTIVFAVLFVGGCFAVEAWGI